MKIVDLSCDVAGRFAAKLFAMAGSRVVRPASGDDHEPGPGAPLAIYLDAHKTLVAAASPAALAALIVDADLVFTSFDAGRWLGLASEPLALPKTCIQITTSTFGVSGPYAHLRGGPAAEWSAGGYFGITGEPDRPPLMGPEHLCGYVAGYTAAIAAEAALHERRRSGEGQHVDVSVMEAMLCVHQSTFARVAAGTGRERTGRYTEVYPLVVRPCKDGYVSLGVVTDVEFDRLAIACERHELTVDERFVNQAARWTNRDALDLELDVFLRERTAGELVTLLQANGVPAAEVADSLEVLANPQLVHRGFWEQSGGADGPRMPGDPVPPAKVFAKPAGAGAPSPLKRWAQEQVAQGDTRPLVGTVVIDFTAFWAGPSATRCLADLGAEVIKVERPGSRVDFDDDLADPRVLIQHLYHCKMNRHKRSVVVDLSSAAGRDAARHLASQADIVVENFRPGVAERLGIGFEELCRLNPNLVYVSLSGFGSGGPWGDWRSYGPSIEAASSIMSRTGYIDGEPLRLGHTLPDGVGGLVGALAALRGLRERETRGCGGWFDLSQLEAYVAISGEDILLSSRRGQPLPLIGNRSRGAAFQGVFPCKGEDQWIAIRLADALDAERLATATGVGNLAQALATTPRDDGAVEAMIAAYTAGRNKHDLAKSLQEAGLEALPVFAASELVSDPHLRERGFYTEIAIEGRIVTLPGSPLRGDRRLVNVRGSAPRIGEHTAKILAIRGSESGAGPPRAVSAQACQLKKASPSSR